MNFRELKPHEKNELNEILKSRNIMNYKRAICFRNEHHLGKFICFSEIYSTERLDGKTLCYVIPEIEIMPKELQKEVAEDIKGFFGSIFKKEHKETESIMILEINTNKRIVLDCERPEGADIVIYVPDNESNTYKKVKDHIILNPLVNYLIAYTNKEITKQQFEDEIEEIKEEIDSFDTNKELIMRNKLEEMQEKTKVKKEETKTNQITGVN